MPVSLMLNMVWLVPTVAASVLGVAGNPNTDAGGSQGRVAAQEIQEELEAAAEMNAAGQGVSVLRAQGSLALMDSQSPSEAQARLTNSQSRFHRAFNNGRSAEEQAIETDLAAALKSPLTVGKFKMQQGSEIELACLPDVNRCPKGWQLQGSLCIVAQSYKGACKSSTALFDMGVQERLAFARYCQVEFPCQESCVQNFKAICPSLWRQVSPSVCEAPSNYVGKCSRRVHTEAMTDIDKTEFGLKCGARWPCTGPPGRVYLDVCPEGWTMQFGQTCTAPADYEGPCGSFARMGGMGRPDKQAFEVACGVSWPSRGIECERDYAAPCPYGWRKRFKKGKAECISPPTYKGCSRVQTFGDLTPEEKQRWERNCRQRFPCFGEAVTKIPAPVAGANGPVDEFAEDAWPFRTA